MTGALSELLSASPEPEPIASFDVWWRRHRTLAERVTEPIDVALNAGFAADRLGYAFASGYQAAAAAMFATEPTAGPFALCATEAGGARRRSASKVRRTRTANVDLREVGQQTSRLPNFEGRPPGRPPG